MKCPKCHYLSFDPEPRCRNCGYTLSLDPDLAIHPSATDDAPLVDLALRDTEPIRPPVLTPPPRPPRRAARVQAEPARRTRTTTPGPFDEEPVEPAAMSTKDREDRALAALGFDLFESEATGSADTERPARPVPESRPRRQSSAPTSELPLFVKGIGSEPAAAAVTPAAAVPDIPSPVVEAARESVQSPHQHHTTAPLVRPHAGESPRLGPLDRDLLDGLQRIEQAEQRQAAAEVRRVQSETRASAGTRLAAAAVDAVLLGALSTGIVAATLRWTDLDWSELLLLPLVPLSAFVLLVATGYLFMFTAACGQTAGKMLLGIRVVDAGQPGGGDHRVSVRQALYRGALTVPSVLLLGAGFLPALLGDGRALHDRLTRTRVVRA